jgi:DNA repair ATPase RecN
VLMARGGQEGVDGAAVHDVVERALNAMDDVRKVKSQLTGAKTGIDKAYTLVEEMSARVRALLQEIDALVRPADEAPAAPAVDQMEL